MKSIFINRVSSVQLVLKYQRDLAYTNLDGRTNTNKGLKYMTNCYFVCGGNTLNDYLSDDVIQWPPLLDWNKLSFKNTVLEDKGIFRCQQ